MKEVQEKLLPGELGVSPRISLLIPPRVGDQRGLIDGHSTAKQAGVQRQVQAIPSQMALEIGADRIESRAALIGDTHGEEQH
jgi:hypothetical protein